jgi:tetratricopeptide (TPR) repeat protein
VAAASPIQAEVIRIGGLLEGRQFAAGLEAASALAARVPENRDVLYVLAASQRGLGRIADALATLDRLESLHPRFARLFQERGHCCVVLRDLTRAIEAYSRAVSINPALPASWRSLQELYRLVGRREQAALAASQLAALEGLPPEILTAHALFGDGDLIPAEALLREYLREHGLHIEAARLLARIGLELEVLDDVEALLAAVLARAPGYTAARFDYARALYLRQKHGAALVELDTLLRAEPKNLAYRTLYATTCVGIGDHERALAIYRELLLETPNAPELLLSVAHCLKTLGHTAEAIEAYRAAAASRPAFGDAYWSLANLKTYRLDAADVERMRAEEADASTGEQDRVHLCFALGKALEDEGNYAESFRYYERGNALKLARSRYDPDSVERGAALQKACCTRELFAHRRGVGCEAPDPIFIVGLPRSGSTLLEQILASHEQVDGTMELATLPRLVLDLEREFEHGRQRELAREREREPSSGGADAGHAGHSGHWGHSGDPRYPRLLADYAPEKFAALGRRYLEDSRVYRRGRPFFVDKMPNNFRHVGLIHLALPNAKIIDARREPVACCFSNFKQLFASGQEFTYSFEHLGRYYRSYAALMTHWDEVLPGKVLRVRYEDVVADLEREVRRMLAFCGLDYDARCLDFHANSRSVGTPSSEQVRRPIFRESLDQWRHYEPWLGPLRAALEDAP